MYSTVSTIFYAKIASKKVRLQLTHLNNLFVAHGHVLIVAVVDGGVVVDPDLPGLKPDPGRLVHTSLWCGLALLDLRVKDSPNLPDPHSGDHEVLLDVGGGLFEGPEPVRLGPGGIALAQAVGAVVKDPTPPAVNLDLV